MPRLIAEKLSTCIDRQPLSFSLYSERPEQDEELDDLIAYRLDERLPDKVTAILSELLTAWTLLADLQ